MVTISRTVGCIDKALKITFSRYAFYETWSKNDVLKWKYTFFFKYGIHLLFLSSTLFRNVHCNAHIVYVYNDIITRKAAFLPCCNRFVTSVGLTEYLIFAFFNFYSNDTSQA